MYNNKVINQVKDLLLARQETLASAESVTSGHIQAALSGAEMAGNFFQGGITTYNLNQKTRLLRVNAQHALSCNCVSQQVAEEMATHATELFKSDWAIAVTGYATPMPEQGIEDLFAFWAVCYRGTVLKADVIKAEKNDALKVQVYYTNVILESFMKLLDGAPKQ